VSRVYWALICVQVMFAIHYPLTKVLLGTVPASAWAAIRLASAALILLVIHLIRRGEIPPWRDQLRLAGFALFGVVINQIGFIEGLSRTTPTHSALICSTIPVLTLLIAVVMRHERLHRASAIGILCAMTGVLVLLQVDRLELRAEWFLGDLLTQMNALSFAFFLVISKRTIQRIGPLTATTWLLGWGSLGAVAYGGGDALALSRDVWTPEVLLIAAYAVVFPTVLAYFINYWALARVQSSEVALFIYIQPILAAALSAMFLGEVLTLRMLVAGALVFVGVLFATRGAGRSGRLAAAVSTAR
jgi:drug/metabolite transporter (DMT)-like permease